VNRFKLSQSVLRLFVADVNGEAITVFAITILFSFVNANSSNFVSSAPKSTLHYKLSNVCLHFRFRKQTFGSLELSRATLEIKFTV